jgi:cyanophycin synthetase
MKITEIRFLRGPNRYAFKPCMQAVVDLEDLDDVPSTAIAGFVDRLLAALPSLAEHRCSPGYPGGFIERLREGTYMAHVAEHVALELQSLAGHDVGFGKARMIAGRPRHYHVVVSYLSEAVAERALETSLALLQSLARGEPFDLAEALRVLRSLVEDEALGPSTQAIVDAARARGIPTMRLAQDASLFQLGWGSQSQRIQATITGRSNYIAVDIASDKALTKTLLAESGLPVPSGEVVREFEQARVAARRVGWPVTVKPLDANQGKGVTTAIADDEALVAAFERAREWCERVIVETHIDGGDYRVVVCGDRVVAASRRSPPTVAGDGRATIAELVERLNADPARGDGHERALTRVRLDDAAREILAAQGLDVDSVLEADRVAVLRGNANLSTGGMAEDMTDQLHADTARDCVRAARKIGLDVAGIDLVCTDIGVPLKAQRGAIIEVNAAPGIRMHERPAVGERRAVGEAIVDSLFPGGVDGRIPTMAITGTNGKTTTTLAIGHALRGLGRRVGVTTTEGILVDGRQVDQGDCTGYWSARSVLADPDVDVAVLETARGGILKRGLAFDRCDVGVVLNVHPDHLGQDGIDTLDDLADIKGLVAETARKAVVLNADDERCWKMRLKVRKGCEVILFSCEPQSQRLRLHLAAGGRALLLDGDRIEARRGAAAPWSMGVAELPFTVDGHARHNVENALAALAALMALGESLPDCARELRSFACSVESNPLRLNAFQARGVRVLLDYAHNVPAYRAIAATARALADGDVVGVVTVPGDRRDEDIAAAGTACAQEFDRLVIYEMDDRRGRAPGATAALLRQAAETTGLGPAEVRVVPAVRAAVREAVMAAQPGDVVVFGCASELDELASALADLPDFEPIDLTTALRTSSGGNPGDLGAARGRRRWTRQPATRLGAPMIRQAS